MRSGLLYSLEAGIDVQTFSILTQEITQIGTKKRYRIAGLLFNDTNKLWFVNQIRVNYAYQG